MQKKNASWSPFPFLIPVRPTDFSDSPEWMLDLFYDLINWNGPIEMQLYVQLGD